MRMLLQLDKNEVVLGIGAAALERWEAAPYYRDIDWPWPPNAALFWLPC